MSEEEAEAIQYAVDGIYEAFILGGLNESRPEKGHWLERWWNLGREHQALLDLAKARLAELDFLDTPTDAQRAERAELFALLKRTMGDKNWHAGLQKQRKNIPELFPGSDELAGKMAALSIKGVSHE
ncbi:hypothetical protein WM40_22545 [Robbsia andropogonis]|uniref:Uncharacterized protein n=1 Tax=Robbsia andropogonis TaxID=28092 RepID=A0A0F5JV51_9BURK|nr:hypothetical protein [Robbsia andropogonis]KKB61525.1 hypothetical protein WM40_22545 [Robbsia andropogonis]